MVFKSSQVYCKGEEPLHPATYSAIDSLISPLTHNQREHLFKELKENYCIHCGIDDPRCSCQDDS